MKESIQQISSVQARVSIELPPARVAAHLDEFFEEAAKYARVQGFRPGKAPINVVRQFYQEQAVNSIGDKLVSEGLLELIKKHKMKIVLPPKLIAVDAPAEGKPFRFEAELDLRPEVPKLDLSKLKIEGVQDEVIDDERLDKEITALRERFGGFEELSEKRAVQKTDQVTAKYEGFLKTKKIVKASNDKHIFIVGSGQVMPEFEDAVTGMKPGEKKTFEVEFGQDHPAPEVQGRKIKFDLELLDIQQKKLAPLDENLFKLLGPEIKDIHAFRSELKTKLQEDAIKKKKTEQHERISNALVEKYPIEISERQKEMTAQNLFQERVKQLRQMGVPEKEMEAAKEELIQGAMSAAEFQIRLSYLLEELARQNSIDVSLEEIEAHLDVMAKRMNISLAELKRYYSQKNEEDTLSPLDRLKMQLLDEKSLDYALSKARIEKKD